VLKSRNTTLSFYSPSLGAFGELEFDGFFFPGGEPHVNLFSDEECETIPDDAEFIVRVNKGLVPELALATLLRQVLTAQFPSNDATLFLPYFPGARQDRGVPATLHYMANLVELADFDSVFIVDPHSEATERALIGRDLHIMQSVDLVPAELFSYTGYVNSRTPEFVVISPDKGAVKRAQAVADRFGVPLVVAEKHRDPENKFRIGSYSVPEFKADYAVVIDDICDGGGTFLALADAINMPTENLRLWTTHGIYSKGPDALTSKYGMLATTDSFWSQVTGVNHYVRLNDAFEKFYIEEIHSRDHL